MTTLQQIELRCPICDTRFRSQAGDLDELVRWQAHRLPRARGGHAAAAVPDPHVQSLRLLGSGARLHRGGRRDAGAAGARVERARAGRSRRARCRARRSTRRRRRWPSGRGWSRATSPTCCCARPGAAWTRRTSKPSAISAARQRGSSRRRCRASTAWRARSARCSPISWASCGGAWATRAQAAEWFNRVAGEVIGPGDAAVGDGRRAPAARLPARVVRLSSGRDGTAGLSREVSTKAARRSAGCTLRSWRVRPSSHWSRAPTHRSCAPTARSRARYRVPKSRSPASPSPGRM